MKNKTRSSCIHFVFIVFFVTCFISLRAQDEPPAQRLAIIADSIEAFALREYTAIAQDSTDTLFFSPKAYDLYFDKYFTLINYERETFTDGNSAALKMSDNSTRLDLTFSTKVRNSIFSASTGLNVADNTGTLFSGSRPTAGTQFALNNSILISSQRSLGFDDGLRFQNYEARRAIIDSVYRLHVLANPHALPVLQGKLKTIQEKIAGYRAQISRTQGIQAEQVKYQDSLVSALASQEKLSKELAALVTYGYPVELAEAIMAKTQKVSRRRELLNPGTTLFQMVWLSMGVRYRRDNYKTYDEDLALRNRVGQQAFDGWGFTIGPNFYLQKNPDYHVFLPKKFLHSLYANVNYSFAATNNFLALKENTLTTLKSVSSNDTTYQFASDEKLRNITGLSFEKYYVHKIGFQVSGMFGKRPFWGLNFTSDVAISGETKPAYNTRLGALFKFIDSADQKARVNFELFLRLADLTDIGESGDSAWQRREIGITTSVPLQKVFFR